MSYDATKDPQMERLLRQAESLGAWLQNRYDPDIWFSPAELRQAQAKGDFCWGPVNWELRNPQERLAELERRAANSTQAAQQMRERMGRKG